MSPRVMFLDPHEIEEILAEVALVASRDHNNRVVIVGGVAMMACGSDRLTAMSM